MSQLTMEKAEPRVRFRDIADAYGFLVTTLDAARARAAEDERELTETEEVGLLEAALAGVEGQLEDKVAGVVALIRRLEKRVKDRQAETAENHDLNKGDNGVVERLKRTLGWWLPGIGVKSVRTALGTVSIQEERPKLAEVDALPAFLAGYGRATLAAPYDAESGELSGALASLVEALEDAVGGVTVTVTVACATDDPASYSRAQEAFAAHCLEPQVTYDADGDALLTLAREDREAERAWSEACAAPADDTPLPPYPERKLPACAKVRWERTVAIRTK